VYHSICAAGRTLAMVPAVVRTARCADLVCGAPSADGCIGSASRLAGWCGWQLRCSNACSRDSVDRRRDPGRGETPRGGEQRTRWTTWTRRPSVDGDRFTHNPEVAGSNPAPATSFRRSRPFPVRERAFCVSGTVAKRVAATALRTARQRDGGDWVTRDETAWTWWTLPPAISGCRAQRYRTCIPGLFPFVLD
jgi:hypothetical protein